MTASSVFAARVRSMASSAAVAALLVGAAPLAAQEAAEGEMVVQQDGSLAPDPNALVDPAAAVGQTAEGEVVEDAPELTAEQPAEGEAVEGDAHSAEQPLEGQVTEGDPQMTSEQLPEDQVTDGEPQATAEQPTMDDNAEGEGPLADGEPVSPAEAEVGSADQAVPAEGEVQAVTDEAAPPPATELLPADDEASMPQEEFLPAEGEAAADAAAPAEGEVQPVTDEAAVPSDTELLPAPDEASSPQEELLPAEGEAAAVPADGELLPPADDAAAETELLAAPDAMQEELLPPAEGELAAEPDAEAEAAIVVLDPNAPRVQQQLPAGMVRVILQNVSAAPVDVFVDPADGTAPLWVMTINPGFQVIQPIQVGQTWRLAQDDQWMGGFVPNEEADQRVTFAGAPL